MLMHFVRISGLALMIFVLLVVVVYFTTMAPAWLVAAIGVGISIYLIATGIYMQWYISK